MNKYEINIQKLFHKNVYFSCFFMLFLTSFNIHAVLAASPNYDTNSQMSEYWFYQRYGIDDLRKCTTLSERKNIIVAVLDAGVDLSHDALKNNLVKGYNFVDKNKEPCDDNGHGTEIAGLIGGSSPDGSFYGVANGVMIMPVKILDGSEQGDIKSEALGIIWAVDNGARVINLSLVPQRGYTSPHSAS